MRNKPIIIIGGEPYSIFFELFFKTLSKKLVKKILNPIILIASKKLLIKQMKALKFKFEVKEINLKSFNYSKLINKKINIINVDFKNKKIYKKIQ